MSYSDWAKTMMRGGRRIIGKNGEKMNEEERFNKFLIDLAVLFKSNHFDNEQRHEIMAIVLPSFVVKGT